MIRKIISINEEKCNGCGLCAKACHEGAIGMVDGKARLLREDYCDGLGDCLPACPVHAISFEEREALAYDEMAVQAAKKSCATANPCTDISESETAGHSALCNFPIQIKLVPVKAPYFHNGDLLIAADCTAYAYSNFHRDFMKGRVTLVACPKLDAVNYADKLTQIFSENEIRSVTVVRMTVPCCGGLPYAVQSAMENSKKRIPLTIVTITPDGRVLP